MEQEPTSPRGPEGEIAPSLEQSPEEQLQTLREAAGNIEEILGQEGVPREIAEALVSVGVTPEVEKMEEEILLKEDPAHTIEVQKDKNQVRIGESLAPIFQEREVKFSPKLELTKDKKHFQVILEGDDGSTFSDSGVVVDDDNLENPEVKATVKLVEKKQKEAEKERKKHIPGPPKRNPYFVEAPYVVEKMAKFSNLASRQIERKEGILVMVGDAGVGKNLMTEHYAHLTERPLFHFTCSESKEEQDLKYILEFITDEEGSRTVRIHSTLVEALQTPGAVIEIDEINTLKPEIAKILNSLLDYRRTLYFGENDLKVRAAEGVLLVGLMNPEDYAGVKPLPETIRSRARIMEMDYPPYGEARERETKYGEDEALILRQYMPEFEDLSRGEFRALWNQIVNNEPSSVAADVVSSERETRVQELNDIVYIANKIRGAYKDYMTGISDEPVEFVFTLRESVEIVSDLADKKAEEETDMRKLVKDVILEKIPRGEQRIKIETLIDEAWTEVKGA